MDSLVVLLSLITGVFLGWVSHSKVSKAQLEAQKLSADQIRESFAAVAQDSLAKNNQQFLDLAKSNFEKIHLSADKDLQNRQQAVQSFTHNLQQNLHRYEKLMTSFEQDRDKKYGALKEK